MDALSEASSNEKLSSLQKIKTNGTRDTYLRYDVCGSTVFKCNSSFFFLFVRASASVCARAVSSLLWQELALLHWCSTCL